MRLNGYPVNSPTFKLTHVGEFIVLQSCVKCVCSASLLVGELTSIQLLKCNLSVQNVMVH